MTHFRHLDVAQLVKGYAERAFTPVDVIEDCLDRARTCDRSLNAFLHFSDADALQAAEASRRRWAEARPLGALDGVPVSVKDNLHVAGMPTTWGSALMRGFVATQDEAPVARIRAAGAVLFAKTSLPEFAMQGYTTNALKGTTYNPFDVSLTPGGSSGGAAAAVAAFCGPLALATDGGGSIRRPASHCALVGFKPSAGLVKRRGGLPEIFLSHEVVGGIGRNVADVAGFTEILAGQQLAAASNRVRILYLPSFSDAPVDPGIAVAVARAAQRFEAMGHIVETRASFDLPDEINSLWPQLSAIGLAWLFEDGTRWPELGLRRGSQPDPMMCGEAARAALQEGRSAGATVLFNLVSAIERLERRLDTLFSSYDAILTPATAALPWPADRPYPEKIAGQAVGPRGHAVFTAIANAAGLPALALPCGWVSKLPTGFQLFGPKGADAAVLALGREYEQNFPVEAPVAEAGPHHGGHREQSE
ncbi:aspartyl-tRNA(Asn)/glutamyl-tRNA(Gln) amidotransferase subunit A [Bradyrhizobium sp. cir1]|uniref:amidase n=1 Tax=Bradyrhizobium sp. cir1 TaxID=1445730 RepID=UPI001605B8B7|nr:amidase [Bradyrhizobium sp. cir1]MBB4368127.1 aspartyl-tRNA(Asn)/glutamyl-tRNA(Gln) amidotransferase subunit A [Bradyrhizobium sp. cir1]